jgi:hypothetical protein
MVPGGLEQNTELGCGHFERRLCDFMHLLAVLATEVGSELLWAINPVGHAPSVVIAAARLSTEPATPITDDAETLFTLEKR